MTEPTAQDYEDALDTFVDNTRIADEYLFIVGYVFGVKFELRELTPFRVAMWRVFRGCQLARMHDDPTT